MEQQETMEQQQTIGNFRDMRADMVKDYHVVLKEWEDMMETNYDVGQLIEVRDRLEEMRNNILQIEVAHLNKTVVPVLPKIVAQVWNSLLEESRVWKENALKALDEMRKEGVPYQERMEKVNGTRLANIIVVDKGNVNVGDLYLYPIETWLRPIEGYEEMVNLGLVEFVRKNINFIATCQK